MKNLGYTDFNIFENANKNKVNYYNYLNNKIKICNHAYLLKLKL